MTEVSGRDKVIEQGLSKLAMMGAFLVEACREKADARTQFP
jgi:hypothetical protein